MSRGIDTPLSGLRTTRRTKPLADVIAVIAGLAPGTDAAKADILTMLGFSKRVDESGGAAARKARPAKQEAIQRERIVERASPAPSRTASAEREALPSLLESADGEVDEAPPEWLQDMVLMTLQQDFQPGYRKAIAPLFDPLRERALIMSMVMRQTQGTEIDLAAAITKAARLEAVGDVARKMRASVRAGATAIVDIGPSMQPFSLDVEAFVARFRSIVGGGTDIRYTIGPPDGQTTIGDEPGARWKPLRPDAPVVIVSDFGAAIPPRGGPANRPLAWALYARSLPRPPVGLTPFASDRVPAAVRASMTLIEWSRTHRLHGTARR